MLTVLFFRAHFNVILLTVIHGESEGVVEVVEVRGEDESSASPIEETQILGPTLTPRLLCWVTSNCSLL